MCVWGGCVARLHRLEHFCFPFDGWRRRRRLICLRLWKFIMFLLLLFVYFVCIVASLRLVLLSLSLCLLISQYAAQISISKCGNICTNVVMLPLLRRSCVRHKFSSGNAWHWKEDRQRQIQLDIQIQIRIQLQLCIQIHKQIQIQIQKRIQIQLIKLVTLYTKKVSTCLGDSVDDSSDL